jgi:conjugal transfer pilus assembly protein TraF
MELELLLIEIYYLAIVVKEYSSLYHYAFACRINMQIIAKAFLKVVTGFIFFIAINATFLATANDYVHTDIKKEDIKKVGDPYELIQSESHRCKAKGECGWWFGFIDPALEETKITEEEKQKPSVPNPETQEQKCSKSSTWTDECGWVDPKGDFEFLVIMREKLSQNALMYSDDQRHVKEFQKFMLWLVDSAVSYSKTWEWNMMQDQSLNPFARHPVSTFGLRAAVRAKGEHLLGIFDEINEQGGSLVFFTRSDCTYCHVQLQAIKKLSTESGLSVVNVSLDDTCMPGYTGKQCITVNEPLIKEAITAIGINIVPDLFLFLPKDNINNNGWVRVSTGNESVSTIKRRIKMFFEGVRSASAAGLSEAANSFKDQKRPNATFHPKYNKDYVPGTTFTEEAIQGGDK